MAQIDTDLLNSIQLKMQTSDTTVDTTKFTAQGTPAFDAAYTNLPNGHTGKFIAFNGSTDYFTFNPQAVCDTANAIIHFWAKPGFGPTYASNKKILTGMTTTLYDGPDIGFVTIGDKFNAQIYTDGGSKLVDTGLMSWSTNDPLHFCMLYSNTNGLDGTHSVSLYVNNTLISDIAGTWVTTGDDWANPSYLGVSRTISEFWLGGLLDFTVYSYSNVKSGGYTDAEIVDALYNSIPFPPAVTFVPKIMCLL